MSALLALGTLAFHLVEGWNLLDAFYMAMMTLTTVGYGEVHPLSRAGQVLAAAYMMVGVLAVFVCIGVMVDFVVRLEITDYFGRRRLMKTLDAIHGHYIVCGAGRVGRSVTRELLRSGAPVVVVDSDPARCEWAIHDGIPTLTADATSDEALRRARIDTAHGLVAATNSDAQNVYVTLSAKVLNPEVVVVARATDEEAAQKLRRAGATTVLTPYTFVGHRLAHALLRPNVLSFIELTSALDEGKQVDIQLDEVEVEDGSSLAGQTLLEAGIRERFHLIVLGVIRPDGLAFNPPEDARLAVGDVLLTMGEQGDLRRFEAEAGIRRRRAATAGA